MNQTSTITNTSEISQPRITPRTDPITNPPRITSGAIAFMFISLIVFLGSWLYVMVNKI